MGQRCPTWLTKSPWSKCCGKLQSKRPTNAWQKFREEMASVKQERDRYKEQLELMEEEFVKERQGKLDLKEEMQRMQGTIEELQARHAEASKVPDDAGHGKAEDTVKYQSQIATLKAEISSLEVRIKSHESNASTTTSRHEEILSEALQAAAQQSDRAEGLEAKLNTATEKITKLEEEASQRAAADINDAGQGRQKIR